MKNWVLGLAAASFASIAAATPPPAPTVTVAAIDIKQLEFDITPVTRANWYELWFRANPNAQWVKYAETPAQRPLIRIGVSVHLLDWPQARYHVKACNPGGCSTSNEIGVDDEKLLAIGYLKPDPTRGVAYFGGQVAMSADGKTAAVASAETFGAVASSAVVYVYRRTTSTSGWRREARLVPSTVEFGTGPFNGDALSISADGNLIVLGTANESGPAPAAEMHAGAVYLFRRDGTTWHEAQKIRGIIHGNDYFGEVLHLDDAGRTLVVSHDFLGEERIRGIVEVYRDPVDASDQFVHTATLPPPSSAQPDATMECFGVALSGDGQSLFRGCQATKYPFTYEYFTELRKAPDWTPVPTHLPGGSLDGIDATYDASRVVIQFGHPAEVWVLGPGGYQHESDLTNFGEEYSDGHRHVAISRDGKIVANGNWTDVAAGIGPIFPPYETADHPSGGVVIHERRSTGWVLRRAIKPGSTNRQQFGFFVALGDNGRVLIAGAPTDPSAATGIDGDRDDASMLNRGAAWLY